MIRSNVGFAWRYINADPRPVKTEKSRSSQRKYADISHREILHPRAESFCNQFEENMKAVMVFLLVAVLAVAHIATADEGTYTSKFDNINIDEVLASDRLLSNYFDCLMDKKPCTAEGTELKARIPDALKTECAKCTQKQKDGTEKVIRFLRKNKPKMWEELTAKYDPNGEYLKKYGDRLD